MSSEARQLLTAVAEDLMDNRINLKLSDAAADAYTLAIIQVTQSIVRALTRAIANEVSNA